MFNECSYAWRFGNGKELRANTLHASAPLTYTIGSFSTHKSSERKWLHIAIQSLRNGVAA